MAYFCPNADCGACFKKDEHLQLHLRENPRHRHRGASMALLLSYSKPTWRPANPMTCYECEITVEHGTSEASKCAGDFPGRFFTRGADGKCTVCSKTEGNHYAHPNGNNYCDGGWMYLMMKDWCCNCAKSNLYWDQSDYDLSACAHCKAELKARPKPCPLFHENSGDKAGCAHCKAELDYGTLQGKRAKSRQREEQERQQREKQRPGRLGVKMTSSLSLCMCVCIHIYNIK
jgi:hypothetical protein